MTQLALFPGPGTVARDAAMSACGLFRWWLSRDWGEGPLLLWVMLNPSTADGSADDQTLLRITRFSRSWGYGGLRVVNLHPFRSPYPRELAAWLARGEGVEAASRENLGAIRAKAAECRDAIVAWGAGAGPGTPAEALSAVRDAGLGIRCLGTTSSGSPRHPLARGRSRVPDGFEPVPFPPAQ